VKGSPPFLSPFPPRARVLFRSDLPSPFWEAHRLALFFSPAEATFDSSASLFFSLLDALPPVSFLDQVRGSFFPSLPVILLCGNGLAGLSVTSSL